MKTVTGFEISKASLTLRSDESQVQTGPRDIAKSFGQSFEFLGTKYGSADKFDLAQSPSTRNFVEYGGWKDNQDEEDDESQGAWRIAEEASDSLLMGIQFSIE